MSNLKKLPFHNMSHQIQRKIDKYANRVEFSKGEMIFSDDTLMANFYVVLRGEIKNYQINLDNGKEQTLFIYRRGDMFDTLILLDGESHDVMYEVIEYCELLEFPVSIIRELLSEYPEFNQKFFPYIAKQMKHMEELATDLSLYGTAERLIKLIVQDYDPKNIFRFNILKGLSHTEVANLIGTVRHVVERHLNALKEDNLISTKKREIQILDTSKLLEKIKLL